MAPEFLFEDCDNVRDYFIINKPVEEIGGDFYYFNKFVNFQALIVADATGHGIPGAFLSIISIAIFKDILYNEQQPQAADILEKFRIQLKKFLRQDADDKHELRDSVDAALVLFFPEKEIINFSGARRPLYYFSKGELKEIKGSRATAGYSVRELKFENHFLPANDIYRMYLFTDGITDMLRGEEQTKFTSLGWKQLLKEIQMYTMSGQKNLIIEAIEKWTENGRQTDDILIIGIELER